MINPADCAKLVLCGFFTFVYVMGIVIYINSTKEIICGGSRKLSGKTARASLIWPLFVLIYFLNESLGCIKAIFAFLTALFRRN